MEDERLGDLAGPFRFWEPADPCRSDRTSCATSPSRSGPGAGRGGGPEDLGSLAGAAGAGAAAARADHPAAGERRGPGLGGCRSSMRGRSLGEAVSPWLLRLRKELTGSATVGAPLHRADASCAWSGSSTEAPRERWWPSSARRGRCCSSATETLRSPPPRDAPGSAATTLAGPARALRPRGCGRRGPRRSAAPRRRCWRAGGGGPSALRPAGLRLQPLRARCSGCSGPGRRCAPRPRRDAEAEEHRRLGELLRHHRIGFRAARPRSGSPSGPRRAREVEVPLEPTLSPRAQVDRHFHLYRRLSRGSALARERLVTLDWEMLDAERALAVAEAEHEVEVRMPVEPRPVATSRRKRSAPSTGPTACSTAPMDIRSGSAAPGRTTTRSPSRSPGRITSGSTPAVCPGAHVVVPLDREGGGAAGGAARCRAPGAPLSRAWRASSRGEVAWTRARLVQRVKGGAPGQVTYSGEKVLSIRVEPARIERVLRTREENAS